MEISDYNKRLANHRDNFNHMTTEMREAHKKDLAEQESRHKMQKEKMSETYDNQKDRYESAYKNSYDRMSGETSKALARKNAQMKELIEQNNRVAQTELMNEKIDAGEKIRNIKDSYQKAKRIDDNQKEHEINLIKNRLEKNLAASEQNFEGEVKRLNSGYDQAFKEYRQDRDQEKRNMINENGDHIHEIMAAEGASKNKVVGKYQAQMEELRRAQENERIAMKDHQDSLLTSQKNEHNKHVGVMKSNFDELGENMQRKNSLDERRASLEHSEGMKDLSRKFEKDLQTVKRKADVIASQGFNGDEGKANLARLTNSYDEKIERLNDSMEDLRHNQQIDKDLTREGFQDTMRLETLAALKKRDEREKEISKYNEEMIGRFREEKNELASSANREIRSIQAENSENERRNAIHSKKLLENQSSHFGETVNTLADKNVESIQALQNEFKKEKSAFYEQAKRDIHNTKEDMKDSERIKISQLEDTHDKRYQAKVADLERTKNLYEQKMATMEKKMRDEMEQQRVMSEDSRTELNREFNRALDMRDQEGAKEFIALKDQFDRRIEKVKFAQDLHITKLTRRYEDLLTRTKQDYEKELKRRDSLARTEYENLAKNSSLEKDAMRAQYEMRMEKLRLANQSNYEKTVRTQETT